MNDAEDLATRMKMYESTEAQRRAMPLIPVLARLDGRRFSKFTQGLSRPFDTGFMRLMQDVARALVEESGAIAGYQQSDEITLAWYSASLKSQIFFDGRFQKLVSTLAAEATLVFSQKLATYLPREYADKGPTFDCRAWAVPNLEEAANVFLWRQNDAAKNSVSMAAQHYFPHAQLVGKRSEQLQEMLFKEAGVNWNDYPYELKRGSFVRRRTVRRKLSSEELLSLPEKHAARGNPELEIERTELTMADLWLAKIINRAEVLFSNAEPVTPRVLPGTAP